MTTPEPTPGLIVSGSIFLITVLALTFGQLPGESLLWRELQNTGHTLLFVLIAITTLLLLRELLPVTGDRPLLAYLSAGTTSLAVGVAIELVQLSVHRDSSMFDVLRDASGILWGLGLYAGFDARLKAFWLRRTPAYRAGALLVAGGLCVASLFPLARLAVAYVQRDAAFPVIIDFTAGWSAPFLQFKHSVLERVEAPRQPASTAGYQAARLRLDSADYPGVSMREPYPDWSAFEHLVFVIHSEHPHPFSLVLRIHDRHHNQSYSDRFNRNLWIEQGENRFRIPLVEIRKAPARRDMDMSQIAGLILFATDLARPVSFYPGVLRLE